ncbi:unnamed protein product [Phytophthora fragariaefolia]|uniref:Unnamed protein product n=1 Tax=Phytophthora fragariaefolia TaxID=1490495 RepID=A0A9W7CIS4_9STRA|nr:unnamed protein product [Phytophthora fragariaefolia]
MVNDEQRISGMPTPMGFDATGVLWVWSGKLTRFCPSATPQDDDAGSGAAAAVCRTVRTVCVTKAEVADKVTRQLVPRIAVTADQDEQEPKENDDLDAEMEHAAMVAVQTAVVWRVDAAELGIVQFTDADIKREQNNSVMVQTLTLNGTYRGQPVTTDTDGLVNITLDGGESRMVLPAVYWLLAFKEAQDRIWAGHLCMDRVILVFGPMREIMMDGAREFGSQVTAELLSLLQVKQSNPVPYVVLQNAQISSDVGIRQLHNNRRVGSVLVWSAQRVVPSRFGPSGTVGVSPWQTSANQVSHSGAQLS